jgi:DNA-binding NarL/FixJ family response regulator
VTVPCRTLIVDDDDDMAFLITSTIQLADHGLSVAGVASSGEEAMTLLAGEGADVIVLDYRMPGRNGLEVASDILSLNPDQKIVLFSAHLDDATVAAADRIGVRECLSKSNLRDLPDVVRKHCPAA